MARARRRAPTAIGAAAIAAAGLAGAAVLAPCARAYGDSPLSASGIRNQQVSVVAADHQGPLMVAKYAVAEWAATINGDSRALASARLAEAGATARAAAAASRLGRDEAVLSAATAALTEAKVKLKADRSQLRAIAIGMYTGTLTDPQPTSLRQLEAEQARVIDADEVELVATIVDGHVRADLAHESSDARFWKKAGDQVGSDQKDEAVATAEAASAAARTAAEEKTLASDQAALTGAENRLAAAQDALAAALASVAGPASTPAGQLSILGGSALDAAQLAGWYNAQGYIDLTSAPIQQLAAWYIDAGAREGVRGDVAFAQAVLETGGFSSPDAVDLSNFAGIGHCDTCASGWSFPSPQYGVLGQVQLLRIFADAGPGPAGAPPPAIPSLDPSREMSAGCCSTVESLTGVWATDPTYGQQILYIYGQMLGYALASAPAPQ